MATTAWVPEDTFGGRLLLLRHSLGLTSEQIAEKCGLNRASWNTWEHGVSPRNMAEVVEKIHQGTGADRGWLMWGTDLPKRENWCYDPAAAA